jgi:thymidine phosphorylase
VELATTVASEMLMLGGVAHSPGEARDRAADGLRAGVGLAKLREIVEAQGGNAAPLDDLARLPAAPVVLDVTADAAGFVTDVEPVAIALSANRLGAGRARKGDPIDHAVGLELMGRLGDPVHSGAVLARIHARTDDQAQDALAAVRGAIVIGPAAPSARSVVIGRYSTQR